VYALNYPYIGSEYKLRAHNQFLTFALTFGILGLLVFIAYATQTLWYKSLSSTSYLSWIFSWIILLSFFYEDTLETQSGVTFVAFFTVFFVLQKADVKNQQ
jgi:O-antigen ligase